MNYQENFPLNAWLFDLVNIISKREFIEKKDALWQVVEDMEVVVDYYEGGYTPQAVYNEYFK